MRAKTVHPLLTRLSYNWPITGGGGGQAYHFGKNFELRVEGEGQPRTDILRVVLGPYVHYYPCEASEQKN